MASSSGLWTGLMDYELSVSERLVLVPVGGPRCQKGVARCEGRRFTSSRLVGGLEGEMMVCKVT